MKFALALTLALTLALNCDGRFGRYYVGPTHHAPVATTHMYHA